MEWETNPNPNPNPNPNLPEVLRVLANETMVLLDFWTLDPPELIFSGELNDPCES